MAYVIAEPCIGTKDTACVDACPVDCIHPKKDEPAHASEEMLYIDPVECIDCGACVPVCPVSAIFALDDLPESGNTSPSATPPITAVRPRKPRRKKFSDQRRALQGVRLFVGDGQLAFTT